MERKSYENLVIWQKANLVFEMICEDVKKWSGKDKIANSISYQLLDAGGSISSNVAEGYGRGSPREFRQFLRISRGSLAETDNWLYKAYKQGLITGSRRKEYIALFDEIAKMTSSLMRRIVSQLSNN